MARFTNSGGGGGSPEDDDPGDGDTSKPMGSGGASGDPEPTGERREVPGLPDGPGDHPQDRPPKDDTPPDATERFREKVRRSGGVVPDPTPMNADPPDPEPDDPTPQEANAPDPTDGGGPMDSGTPFVAKGDAETDTTADISDERADERATELALEEGVAERREEVSGPSDVDVQVEDGEVVSAEFTDQYRREQATEDTVLESDDVRVTEGGEVEVTDSGRVEAREEITSQMDRFVAKGDAESDNPLAEAEVDTGGESPSGDFRQSTTTDEVVGSVVDREAPTGARSRTDIEPGEDLGADVSEFDAEQYFEDPLKNVAGIGTDDIRDLSQAKEDLGDEFIGEDVENFLAEGSEAFTENIARPAGEFAGEAAESLSAGLVPEGPVSKLVSGGAQIANPYEYGTVAVELAETGAYTVAGEGSLGERLSNVATQGGVYAAEETIGAIRYPYRTAGGALAGYGVGALVGKGIGRTRLGKGRTGKALNTLDFDPGQSIVRGLRRAKGDGDTPGGFAMAKQIDADDISTIDADDITDPPDEPNQRYADPSEAMPDRTDMSETERNRRRRQKQIESTDVADEGQRETSFKTMRERRRERRRGGTETDPDVTPGDDPTPAVDRVRYPVEGTGPGTLLAPGSDPFDPTVGKTPEGTTDTTLETGRNTSLGNLLDPADTELTPEGVNVDGPAPGPETGTGADIVSANDLISQIRSPEVDVDTGDVGTGTGETGELSQPSSIIGDPGDLPGVSGPETKTGTRGETGTITGIDVESRARTRTETDTDTRTETETDTGTRTDTDTEVRVTPDPDTKVTPDPDVRVTPDPDPRVTPDPDPDPDPTPDPDPDPTPDPTPALEFLKDDDDDELRRREEPIFGTALFENPVASPSEVGELDIFEDGEGLDLFEGQE